MIRHRAAAGIRDPRTTVAHGVWIAPGEFAAIPASGASVALRRLDRVDVGLDRHLARRRRTAAQDGLAWRLLPVPP